MCRHTYLKRQSPEQNVVDVSSGAGCVVGVTIHALVVWYDWFFVCSSAVLNECLNGVAVNRLQFLQGGMGACPAIGAWVSRFERQRHASRATRLIRR